MSIPSPTEKAYYRVVSVLKIPGSRKKQLTIERTEKPITPAQDK